MHTVRRINLLDLLPLMLGTIGFILVTGGSIIWPSNIAWLSKSDFSTHYLGWAFFRNTPWALPLGLNPQYGLELSSSIFFSDSIPLLALFFKLVSSWLPMPFQYFGIWIYSCFLLQAWFSWKLVGLFSVSIPIRLFAVGVFIFSPPFLWRLDCHPALVAHWVILAALYINIGSISAHKRFVWPALIGTVSLIHAYLLACTIALWLADLLKRFFFRKEAKNIALMIEGILVCGLITFLLWLSGFVVYTHGNQPVPGFGNIRMNILSPIDSSGWSYLLGDLPQKKGDIEGFNFLGLGMLIASSMAIPLFFEKLSKQKFQMEWLPLTIVLVCLTLFSITNNIGIGDQDIVIKIPSRIVAMCNVLRASGRMFWPMFYMILWISFYLLVQRYHKTTTMVLFFFISIVQIVDTRAGWSGINYRLSKKNGPLWDSPLRADFWKQSPKFYSKVRMVPPGSHRPNYDIIAYYALSNRMSTDAVYLARMDYDNFVSATNKANTNIKNGTFEADSLYFLDDNAAKLALISLQPESDMLQQIDGFIVLAPNWKRLSKN